MESHENKQDELTYFRQMEEDLASFAKVGYWTYNVEQQLFSWSKGVYLSFGLSFEELRPTLSNYLSKLHPQDIPVIMDAVQQAVNHHAPYNINLRHLQPDGSYRHIKSTAHPIIENNKVTQLRGVMIDVTESYENDQRIVQLTKMHQNIHQALEHSATIFILSKEGRFVYMNDLCNDLLGSHISETEDLAIDLISSSITFKRAWVALQKGQVWVGDFKVGKHTSCWIHATITPLMNEKHEIYQYLAIGYDITTQKKSEIQKNHALRQQAELSLKYQELNEKLFFKQKQLESQLQEIKSLNIALTKREHILNHMGSIASVTGWEMDVKSRKVTWTKEYSTLFGISNNAPAPTFNELCRCLSPGTSKALKQNIRALANHEINNFDFEGTFHSLNDDIRWVRISCQHFLEETTKIHGIIKDITARKDATLQLIETNSKLQNKLEEERVTKEKLSNTLKQLQETQMQLVHAEKMSSLGQIAAGVAHEINNPINFVYVGVSVIKELIEDVERLLQCYPENLHLLSESMIDHALQEAEAIKEEIDLEQTLESAKEVLDTIEEGASRTSQIVRSLRNFSRVDEASVKRIDIHEGLDSTLLLLSHELRSGIRVIKEYTEKPPKVECQPGAINQVFMNLLANAIQAIETEGEIIIHTEYDDDFIYVRIKDSGVGIPDDIRKHIFNPFFTTKPTGKGTGLGLSISNSIIEKHHGKINVKSDQGKGATFELKLPLTMAASA